MIAIERFLSALRTRGLQLGQSGTGWSCRCPAHPDKTPSLSIHTGDDGRVLVKCHAGCSNDAVCGAVGLRLSDLFPDAPSRRHGRAARPRPPVTVTETPNSPARDGGNGDGDARTYPTARDAVAVLERQLGPLSCWWTYQDAAGEPVAVIVRWDFPADPFVPGSKPSKTIRPVSRKPDGSGWVIRKAPNPHPLYGLPALLAAPPGSRVWVCEGEKAADAAQAVGLLATTSAGGAERAKGSDWSVLAGHDVVILPDHDGPGGDYAADVKRLALVGGARSVRIVRLVEVWAGMPEGGDMADLLNERGGDVDPIRADVEALADKAEAETTGTDAPGVPVFVPFPVDVLPEPLRSFVREAAKAIGCDACYIASPLLSGLASAIGNTHRIALKRGWTEPAIVWTAIVGESGTMKTPAFKLAMKPIRKAQDRAWKEYESARAEWEAQSLRYDAEVTAWKRDAAKAKPGDGYGVAPPERPAPPVARRYIVSDTTTEALAPILLGNPRGVLLARDELAGWLGSFDRYAKAGRAGADSAHWLSMHNGEAMTIDRKTGTPPTIHVPSASVSITGGIQPGILARAMGQEHHESGMAARVLCAMPPRKAKRWTEAEVDAATEAAVEGVFERLFGLTPATDDEGDERPRLVTLADDGKRTWVTFYNEHATEQAELSGDLSAAWSKLEGYAARLALVIHLARWAAKDPSLRDPGQVDAPSIAAGVTLARWYGDEARRVYAMLSETDEDRKARRLVEWIQRGGKGRMPGTATVRDLTHGLREYREDPDGAEAALAALVAAGVGRWVTDTGPKGGRPAKRFRLESAVTVTETPPNPGDTGGSGDGDTRKGGD